MHLLLLRTVRNAAAAALTPWGCLAAAGFPAALDHHHPMTGTLAIGNGARQERGKTEAHLTSRIADARTTSVFLRRTKAEPVHGLVLAVARANPLCNPSSRSPSWIHFS